MSDWKNVQYKDGKYRTSEGGGGGSSTFAGLDDVSFNNIQNGQVPKYNSTTQKWENADESGGSGTVTDVQVDGTSVVNAQGVAEITMPIPPTIPVQDVQVDGTSVVNAQGVAEIQMPTPPTPDYPVTDVKVNGSSVVSNKQALITSYKEITQSEYESLPASKLNDGIAYFISDSVEAEGFPPRIYSLQEREIGVWIDGKPLYEKTISLGSSIYYDTNWHEIAHGISNIDKVVKMFGFLYDNSSNEFVAIPNFRANTSAGITLKCNATNIVYMNNWVGTSNLAFITLQYTKTTDIAGSGIWAGNGAMAHHYSTDEVIVGTWTDGKPLYEKVITQTLTQNTSASIKAYPHNIPNISEIVLVLCKENRSRPTNSSAEISIAANATELVAETGQDRSSYIVTVILQYTKTTD